MAQPIVVIPCHHFIINNIIAIIYFFVFRAEDGIRARTVTGSSDVCSSDLQPRPADEGTGEREHLLLAAAEGTRLLIATTLQPGEVLEDPRSLCAQGAPL